jgi:predicted transcriptional regulator
MQLARATIESCIATLPDIVDPEEVMYRLYLLGKIEAGAKDIREGKTVTHETVMERFSSKWQK